MPAYRSTYQASAWREARLAADAGIDFGMAATFKTFASTGLLHLAFVDLEQWEPCSDAD
jgi:hypothetical protein